MCHEVSSNNSAVIFCVWLLLQGVSQKLIKYGFDFWAKRHLTLVSMAEFIPNTTLFNLFCKFCFGIFTYT